MTERLVHGLMCHHIRVMDVSSLVSVLKLYKLFLQEMYTDKWMFGLLLV